MTTYALLMPTTPTAVTSTAKDSKPQYEDSVRSKRSPDTGPTRKTSHTSEIKTKDDKSETASTDLTLFEQMMASLLNTSPVQTQTTVTVNPLSVGDDTTVAATSQFGVTFNMEPALLILPQDVSGTAALTATATEGTSFNAELLAALTPGIPAPVTDQAAPMSEIEAAAAVTSTPVSVPVPVTSADAAITTALTVDSDISVDPRLVACGIDPVQMEELKTKLAALPASPPTATQTAAPGQTQAQNPATPASNVTTDTGVISVAFTMPKPQSVAATPAAPANVQAQAQTQTTAVAETVIATVKTAETALPLSVAVDAAIKADAASSKISDAEATQAIISGEDNFDPVEFRIAQSFSKRPLTSSPANSTASTTSDTNVPAQTNISANVSAQTAATHTTQTNDAVHGKVNIPSGDTASSLLPALSTMDGFSSEMNLTASPAALPVTVSPLTSSVVHSANATQSHPAIHAAAAVIAKNAKEGGPQTISMRLDPPELGKLQVEMKYKKGDPLKVHVVLEKADTASMFMRDAHALETTLKEAGLQLDGSSLSFEFSGDGSFQQALKSDGSSHSSVNSALDAMAEDIPAMETTTDIYTDIKTGLTHYSLKV